MKITTIGPDLAKNLPGSWCGVDERGGAEEAA